MDVSQYLEIFIDETSEHIQSLSDNIMTLENEPEDKDTINEIFRAAHSLKGMAGTMGFKRMQHLTHDMENVFQEVRSDKIKVNSNMIDLLFQCLDAIEGYLNNIKETQNEGENDNEAIIKKLNSFIDGSEAAEAEQAQPPKEEAPAAAAKSDSSDGTVAHFLDGGDFDTIDKKVSDARDAGKNIFGFTVYVASDCLLKAARAFLVFKAVEDLGEIIYYNPSSQDIEDEKFEEYFNIFVATDNDVDTLKKAILGVSEIEAVACGEITDDMLDGTRQEETSDGGAEEDTSSGEEETKPAEIKAESEESSSQAPAKTQATGGKAVSKPVASRTVRVDIEKLDALMNQVSELIIAKNSLASISTNENVMSDKQGFHDQIEYLERITTNLHESVMKVRMVPIESVVNKYPRMIRDLSRKLNKKMELHMSGEETELDRTVVDQIGDPLQHLLRNSADHGLESAEIRAQRGKPEVGTITLDAFQEGNNVIIQVSDDGNGIDTESVKKKAIERGIVTPEQAENLSEKEIIDFLFMPSFSMAKTITDISGRGVGLDVVKSGIQQLGGDVDVKTKLGEGTTFTVRLPLTLAIIQALMVEVGTEKYAIALGSISGIEDIPLSDIKYVEAKEVIHLRGQVIPIIRLDNLLGIEKSGEEPESLVVVVVAKGDKLVGLVVDNLIGQQEIVIKSLGKFITNEDKIISGATILGDGEVALILDVNTLM